VAAEIIVETLLATIAARKAELDQLRIRAPAGRQTSIVQRW
jgi:hypothetical protein